MRCSSQQCESDKLNSYISVVLPWRLRDKTRVRDGSDGWMQHDVFESGCKVGMVGMVDTVDMVCMNDLNVRHTNCSSRSPDKVVLSLFSWLHSLHCLGCPHCFFPSSINGQAPFDRNPPFFPSAPLLEIFLHFFLCSSLVFIC